MSQADYVFAAARPTVQTNVGQFQMMLKSTTKVGLLVGLTTMLLTMNVLTTLLVMLVHWLAHTYLFPY
jgi:hypothetical protein